MDRPARPSSAIASGSEPFALDLQLAEARMPAFLKSQGERYEAAPQLAPEMEAAIQAARRGLEAVVKRNGAGIEAVVTVETDRPVTTAVLLLSLMPRAAAE